MVTLNHALWMCTNANDVTDYVIDKHMVGGMIYFDEHMAMTSPFMAHGNDLTFYGTLKGLKLCRVALHIHIPPSSIQLDK